MFSLTEIIMLGVGAFILLLWIIFFIKGLKFSKLFDSLTEKEFPFKEIYFVGYAVMDTIRYKYKSKHDRKLRKEICVLYSEKYADFYLRVVYSQKVTIAFTILTLAVPMSFIADSMVMAFLVVVLAGAAYYYFGTATEKKILKRSEEMLSDFSNVVSKLALLTNAGMVINEAWQEVASTGKTVIYVEMQKAVDEMNNGISNVDAFINFGSRCIIPEIKKFASTIAQGLVKGNAELAYMLQQQSKEVWSAKKQNVRRQGEKAASKLMIPIVISFIGILIMIIVPIFTNLGI